MKRPLLIALLGMITFTAYGQDGEYYKNPYEIQDSLFSQPAPALTQNCEAICKTAF